MPPCLRPLLVACLITVLAAPLAAKTKSKKIITPLPISACVDFYASSNAEWLRNYPLPAGTASHSRWDDLNDLAARQTAELVASTQAGSSGTASALLADLVASGSNESAIETAGPQALQPLMAQIDGIRKPADIARVAAALQSPVFDGQAGAADYGAFGALLAQQMSQDVRRLKGADASAWAARSAPLIAQYDAYIVTGSSHVSGTRTVAQNAADLTGLEIAWDALNAKGPLDDTGKKAFFSAWAHVWARQDSDAGLRAMLDNSEFAPAKWRVNGPLSNLPAFAQTYDCKAGQPMLRPGSEQVALWR